MLLLSYQNKVTLAIYCIAFIVFFPCLLFGQSSAKATKWYQKAMTELQKNDSDKAIEYLKSALKEDTGYKDAHLALYKIYLARSNGDLALDQLLGSVNSKDKDQANLRYHAGKLAMLIGKYKIAKDHLEGYLNSNTRDSTSRLLASHLLEQANYGLSHSLEQVNYTPVKLNSFINSGLAEYLPSIDASGHTLIFTRRSQGQEDLFIAKRSDADWVSSIPWAQNTRNNEGAHVISADGKTIVFTRCDATDGLGSCDLYSSEFKNGTWARPRNMGSPVNTSNWESQPTLSANGRILYFVSNRPGGQGGYDIWMSKKISNKWTRPVNPGTTINTGWDELSPWLHADGTHLYFRSNGWPGYGSFDLFVSTLLDSNSRTKPHNLGFPINDYKDQGAMCVGIDGSTAYLTDQAIDINNALTGSDIVQFTLTDKNASAPCVFIQGKVKNAYNGDAIRNAVILINSNTNTSHRDTIYTDDEGEYLVVLPRQEVYQLFSRADGYDFYSDRIAVDSNTINRVNYDFSLTPAMKGDTLAGIHTIVLKNVLFEVGSAILTKESFMELDLIAEYLNVKPELNIDILGHTDNAGNSKANLALSNQRAKAVRDYLFNKKIAPARMSYQGYGDTRPLVPNDNETNKAINRRVEIRWS